MGCHWPHFEWWTSTLKALCPAVSLSVPPHCCTCLPGSDRLMATGGLPSLILSWASAGSRPTTSMLTSRELHQEVGFWVAGTVATWVSGWQALLQAVRASWRTLQQ